MRRRLPLILATLLIGGAGAVTLARALAIPDDTGAGSLVPDPQAGLRVQSVVAQLLLRESGLSPRQDSLALSDTEVNVFLAKHVEVRDPPVWPVRVQIHPDGVELGGVTNLGRLIEGGLGSSAAHLLPGPARDLPVWIAVRGQITVTPGGRAEFLAHTAVIGRERVPVAVLWRAVGGRPPALVWRMPRVVDRVDLESGRLVIHTRRPGSGRGAPG
jgi:hypothetical protein